MLHLAVFWLVVVVFAVVQTLLLGSAIRMCRQPQQGVGARASDPRIELAWTIVAVVASCALLAAVYMSITNT